MFLTQSYNMASEYLGSQHFYDESLLCPFCNCMENGLQMFSFCAAQKQESQMFFFVGMILDELLSFYRKPGKIKWQISCAEHQKKNKASIN